MVKAILYVWHRQKLHQVNIMDLPIEHVREIKVPGQFTGHPSKEIVFRKVFGCDPFWFGGIPFVHKIQDDESFFEKSV